MTIKLLLANPLKLGVLNPELYVLLLGFTCLPAGRFVQPGLQLISDMSIRIYSLASIAANPMLAAVH